MGGEIPVIIPEGFLLILQKITLNFIPYSYKFIKNQDFFLILLKTLKFKKLIMQSSFHANSYIYFMKGFPLKFIMSAHTK
jgi:hypothetical protein